MMGLGHQHTWSVNVVTVYCCCQSFVRLNQITDLKRVDGRIANLIGSSRLDYEYEIEYEYEF